MAHRFDCPPRPARLSSWLPSVLLVTMLAACGPSPPPPEPEPGTPAATVVVSVQNQSVSDMDVFANVNGVRQRLGTVTAQGSSTFEVNWGQIGSAGRFSLIVSPVGGRGAYRRSVHPSAGQPGFPHRRAGAAQLDDRGVLAATETSAAVEWDRFKELVHELSTDQVPAGH